MLVEEEVQGGQAPRTDLDTVLTESLVRSGAGASRVSSARNQLICNLCRAVCPHAPPETPAWVSLWEALGSQLGSLNLHPVWTRPGGQGVPAWPVPPHRLLFQRNAIHTAKYNVFSFLPLNLYEQFHRMSNLYFLLIIVLQVGQVGAAPGVSTCAHSFQLFKSLPPGEPSLPILPMWLCRPRMVPLHVCLCGCWDSVWLPTHWDTLIAGSPLPGPGPGAVIC